MIKHEYSWLRANSEQTKTLNNGPLKNMEKVGETSLRLISWLITKASNGIPFESEAFDNLANAMQVTKVLKKNKLDRYNKTHTVRGGLCFLDRLFFDMTYFDKLLPDEVLAVGAHEFTHLNQKHGRERFKRMFAPALIAGTAIGLFVFLNFELFKSVNFFNEGELMFSLTVSVFSLLFASIAGLYANAKWLRQQETECDISTVKFVNGEAMVSALTKLNQLRPRKITRLELLLLPFYPTLEQRINDIRAAEQEQKNQNPHDLK
jgi:hypothetical protein